jgi:hypothetical protein
MALSSLTVEARGLDGIPYRIDVNGGGTVVTANGQFFVVDRGESEDRSLNPIWPSEARIFMRDVDVSPLFGEPDRGVPVKAFDITGGTDTLVFSGYMVTDFFGDAPFASANIVELQALDGLGTLENDPIDDLYTGDSFVSYQTAIVEILRGLTPLSVEIGAHWYPTRSSITASDNPLESVGFAPNNYREDRPEGDYLNQLSLLRDLLKGTGATVQQVDRRAESADARWHVRQRDALNEDGTIKAWVYTTATDSPSPTTLDRSRSLSVSDLLRDHGRDFVRRRQVVQVTHDHVEIENFLADPGFDEDDGSWGLGGGGDISADIISHDNSAVSMPDPDATQDNPNLLEVEKTAENDPPEIQDAVVQDAGDIVEAPNGAYFRIKATTGGESTDKWPYLNLSIGSHYLNTFRTSIQQDALKGEGNIFIDPVVREIPNGARLPVTKQGELVPQSSIQLRERARVGDSELRGEISNDVDSGWEVRYLGFGTSSEDVAAPFFNGGWPAGSSSGFWLPIDLKIALLDSSENKVSGDTTIRLRHVTGVAGISKTYWDSFSTSIEVGGSPVDQTITQASVPELGETDEQTVRTSSGPTTQNLARLRGSDPNGDDFEPTEWRVGAPGSGSGRNVGDSLAELKAYQRLRYWQNHNQKLSVTAVQRDGGLPLTGDELDTLDRTDYTVHSIKYDAAQGESRATLIEWNDYQ